MADAGEWQGGKLPGGVHPYFYKRSQDGWYFRIKGAEAKKLPRDVPRSKKFSFKKFGEGAKAAAETYQSQIAKDHGFEVKNQYCHCVDPRDGLPYLMFHIRDTAGKDHYPMCDVEDLLLLEEHTWCVDKKGKNTYVVTHVRIDGKRAMKYFHSFKCPDWPIVDHYSEIQKENRNGLDNRSKHLRDGSGGVNNSNCRLQKNNKSGVTGVCYDNTRKVWFVQNQHKGVRSPPRYFHGPEDKTHPSYHEACAYAREQAAKLGNTNGQMPEDPDEEDAK